MNPKGSQISDLRFQRKRKRKRKIKIGTVHGKASMIRASCIGAMNRGRSRTSTRTRTRTKSNGFEEEQEKEEEEDWDGSWKDSPYVVRTID